MATSTGGLSETAFPGKGQEHERASSSMGQLTKYDVFLNHRGPDLKKTFVSHLNKALRVAGCEPFLDAKALVKGQHAFKSINEALSGVVVHVAIFSRRYAESKYCLNELCDMLASKKAVIPVFYDVEPENLRRTDVGPFAEAFGEHLRKGRDADVVRWRAGLMDAAAITGFKLMECDNDTVKLEEEVVAAVLNALPRSRPPASARRHVGLEETSKSVIDMLERMGDKVGAVGICGMGGIGKTTLAREVFNREHSKYGSWCYLSDVKEAKGVGVMELQMKMVTELVQVDARKTKWDCAGWFDRIRKLRNRVLLVIDDVNKRQQFDELVPDLRELPGGSRVLITSRESGVLKSIMWNVESEVYYVPELKYEDSWDLFVWCAFQRRDIATVDDCFHGFAEDITRACCGLPLALEVMGGFLSDKKSLPDDERYWREATFALQKDDVVMSSLRMSYESLGKEEKRMFLEVACVMIGHPKRIAIEVWNSSGFGGSARWSLSKLIDKCLVKLDMSNSGSGYRYERDVISMHDLLRDMGRGIVIEKASHKLEMRSYIWDHVVAMKLLQKKQGSDEVLALSVIGQKCGIACKAEVYARMRELRYLFLDNCPVNGGFSEWSEELRWLQWRYFPHEELPSSLMAPNLTVLDLGRSDCLIRVWDTKHFKSEIPCGELQMLILNGCTELRELPQSINKLVKLKAVNLEGCGSLSTLPDSLGDLTELDYLNLGECRSLSSLPESLGGLTKLEYLNLRGCSLIEYLPNSVVKLVKLRELCVGWTGLRELPMEIGRLKNLAKFAAEWTKLEELPESFGLLEGLTQVDVRCCQRLQNLSEDFGCLGNLRELDLCGCSSLTTLPRSFSDLSNLESLTLDECGLLHTLPPSIHGLKKLRILHMWNTGITGLPGGFGQLESLKEVVLGGCKQLETLCENFGCLKNLRKLCLHGCGRLSRLPDSFSELSNLGDLDLSWCKLDQKLLCSIFKLKKQIELDMSRMTLEELPEQFRQLMILEEVNFSGCKQLRSLCEDFGWLKNLQTLNLDGCESLSKLPESFSNLSNLVGLNLSHCKVDEESLLLICKLTKLQSLKMRYMAFEELPSSLVQLHSMRKVDLSGCKQLHCLCRDFGSLGSLQDLRLGGCESLTKLPDSFSNLSNLEELWMNGCRQVKRLPCLHKLKKLRVLHLKDMALEILLEDFGLITSLTRADFGDCTQLRLLCDNLGDLGSLEMLCLRNCYNLINLPLSFSHLCKLEHLEFSGCTLLDKLPTSFSSLKRLSYLYMGGTALEALPEDFGQLECLTNLSLRNCKQLEALCEDLGCLGNLRLLDLNGCERLMKLPDSFSNLSKLVYLDLSWCKELRSLPPVFRLKKLSTLGVGSTALEELPQDFGRLQNLQYVDFNDCKQLQTLCDNFGHLRSLRELNLMFCESLRKLPDSFSSLSRLVGLRLYGCKVLRELPPSIHGLKELRILHMGSTALEELPEEFGQLGSLREADFRSCKQLQKLCENFGRLGSLRELNLDGCESLTKLPASFSYLSNLKELSAFGSKHIEKLPRSIWRLKHLRVAHEEYGLRRTPGECGTMEGSTSRPKNYLFF